jgi:hypothetical protein
VGNEIEMINVVFSFVIGSGKDRGVIENSDA